MFANVNKRPFHVRQSCCERGHLIVRKFLNMVMFANMNPELALEGDSLALVPSQELLHSCGQIERNFDLAALVEKLDGRSVVVA